MDWRDYWYALASPRCGSACINPVLFYRYGLCVIAWPCVWWGCGCFIYLALAFFSLMLPLRYGLCVLFELCGLRVDALCLLNGPSCIGKEASPLCFTYIAACFIDKAPHLSSCLRLGLRWHGITNMATAHRFDLGLSMRLCMYIASCFIEIAWRD